VLGSYSLLWDEAQKLAGKDPDFHRRDLWEAIERGDFPEFELGVQIIEEQDESSFTFDLLDPTKLIPEELVPVQIIGKMTLNRNPDNFFAETEQVAFHPGHVVPGIDFSNDPLLQGRLFSYTDTQISRLGGPNFHEIPINRPVCPFQNNQRDAMHRQAINVGQASYEPNSLNGGWPKETDPAASDGGFETYHERVDGTKIRVRSESFADHFSQAALFYRSMSEVEKAHISAAYQFELGKVTKPEIRERVVNEILANFDAGLAAEVATGLGLPAPKKGKTPATAKPETSSRPARLPCWQRPARTQRQLASCRKRCGTKAPRRCWSHRRSRQSAICSPMRRLPGCRRSCSTRSWLSAARPARRRLRNRETRGTSCSKPLST
jgi:catalase